MPKKPTNEFSRLLLAYLQATDHLVRVVRGDALKGTASVQATLAAQDVMKAMVEFEKHVAMSKMAKEKAKV